MRKEDEQRFQKSYQVCTCACCVASGLRYVSFVPFLSLSPPSFLSLLPPFLSPSLLQQKLSEAQKACERVYALEELIETLQEEQQVSHDESSGHTQCPSRELARLFAERGWPWYLTGGLGGSVWIEWLCSPACHRVVMAVRWQS